MKPAIVFLALLSTALLFRVHALETSVTDNYWKGWHEGKAAQLWADDHEVKTGTIDGESADVQ